MPPLVRVVVCVVASLAAVVLVTVVWMAHDEHPPQQAADVAGRRFLSLYMEDDGRVVRRDAGGDTVSEGQAYAMLVAVGVGDLAAFEQAWSWARSNLARADGMLAWRWENGQVTDWSAATDADLDAAWALTVAAQRWDAPGYAEDAEHLAEAILDNATVRVGGRSVLVAGGWAKSEPYTINPSYFSPAAYEELAHLTGDERWFSIQRSSRLLLTRLLTAAALPPDWALLHADGRVAPIGSVADPDTPGRFSFDAARTPVRYAVSCDPVSRALAATMAQPLGGDPDKVRSSYDLAGNPGTEQTHPLALVGAAGAAHAEGDAQVRDLLLAEAEELDREQPGYYGSAWVALGRLLLQTERLVRC